MAKTTSPGPKGTGLKDVVDTLNATNLLLATQGNAITRFMEQSNRESKVQGKKDVENQRENKKGSRIMGVARGSIRGLAAMTGIPALAGGLGAALSPIISGLSFLLTPIKLLAKLVIKGGPLALVVGGLYALFNDIAENENFKKSIDSIKTLWNDNIVPAFQSIKDTVAAISNNEGVRLTFQQISDWFTNFKIQIQDWVLGNLVIITETIAGVLDGIDSLLQGDWKEGLTTIGTTLFNGIKNLFDNTITNILEMFGVDFGEGGTFLGSVGNIIDSLLVKMINIWHGLKTGVKDAWDGLVNFFTGEDGYIRSTITSIKISMTTRWNNFKDGVMNLWTGMTTTVKTKVSELLEPLTVTLPNKIGEIKDGLIDSWNNIKNKIMEALTKVALWFAFKPKELGLMLEEKWVETKGKFMEKLASLAGTLSSIPSQLKLAALQGLKDTPGLGYLVSDERLAQAKADVAAGNIFADQMIRETRNRTTLELDRINREKMRLQEQKAKMEQAATTVIQQNTGGATVNTTNISQGGGRVDDPYANSYMGQSMPSFI